MQKLLFFVNLSVEVRMNNKEKMIKIENGSVKKDLKIILSELNFELHKGNVVAIKGTAGSGKTTFAQLLAGEISLYEGVFEKNETFFPYFVSQQDNFFLQTSMNLTYHSQRYEYTEESEKIPKVKEWLDKQIVKLPVDKKRVEQIFSELKIDELFGRNLLQLSNGERKRTQIAIALLHNATGYIFDQPFLGLDKDTRELLHKTIIRLKSEGNAVVLVCGEREIREYVDTIVSLDKGKIVKKETFETFSSSLKNVIPTKRLNFVIPKTNSNAQFEYIVRMKDVVVKMNDEILLNNINWEVKQGERWLLQGHNGSGKSTLLSLITGDNPQAYSNDVGVFGQRRGTGESVWDIKSKIGYVSPELHLYFLKRGKTSSSRKASLTDVKCIDVIISGFNDEIGFSSSVSNVQYKCAEEWLKGLGLQHLLTKNFSEVSLGAQRMLLLVRALVKNPPLLILDEPCQGIDYEQTQQFILLLDEICTQTNTTLIYVSHSSEEIPSCITNRIELNLGSITYKK